MKTLRIVELIKSDAVDCDVTVKGWVRTKRGNKNVAFIALNDGSCVASIQVVVELAKFDDETMRQIATGACIRVDGRLVKSPGEGQGVEVQASSIEIYGTADPATYPLQKKGHSLEFLRDIAYLRPRTNTFGAVLRIRHAMAFAIHKFFNDRGFYYWNSPLITASDCEGAGAMFQVTIPEIAQKLGLPETVKVAAGAGDNAAAAVGTGTVGNGQCNISLGTSGTIFISSDQFAVDKNNALHAFAHADGHYHLMGCMLSAASCNKWWMDEIIGTKDYGAEQAAITKLGENHVYFLPYLMGERSPHNDPDARGTFIGMTMDTSRADMTQAVLEGVAFALRDSFEIAKSLGIQIDRTKICGGGAKSLLWKKIIANVLNVKVDVPETEEGPGYGAAILAAVACGEYASVEEAAQKLLKVVDTVEPDAELAAKYEERYAQFKQIYPTVKELFGKLK